MDSTTITIVTILVPIIFTLFALIVLFKALKKIKVEPTQEQANVYEGMKSIHVIDSCESDNQVDVNRKLKDGWIVLSSRIFKENITFILGLPIDKTYKEDSQAFVSSTNFNTPQLNTRI